MDVLTLVLQLAGGAVGGNLAGSAMKSLNLGSKGNSLAGAIGGLLGGQIFERALEFGQVASDAGGLDLGALVSQLAGGGVGGAVMMTVVGLLRRMFAR